MHRTMIQRISYWMRVLIAGLGLCVTSVHALTFDKTLLIASAEQLQKGVAFPLLGLNEESTRFVSVRVFEWHQDKTNNVLLKPTTAFEVFPQLLRVPPDSRRNVTIKLRPGQPISGFYRLVLEEFDSLQAADAAGRDTAQSSVGVVTKPKVTIPMVIGDAKDLLRAELPSEIQISATPMPQDKKVIVEFQNSSDKAIRLASVQYKNQDKSETVRLLQYLLPGVARRIEIELPISDTGTSNTLSFQASAVVVGSEVMKTIPVKIREDKP